MGAVAVLDVWTFNEDRHARNLLFSTREDGLLDGWAIDAGNARVGSQGGLAGEADSPIRPTQPARGQPVEAMARGVEAAIALARALPEADIAAVAEEAFSLVGQQSAAAGATRDLLARREHLAQLCTWYLKHLEVRR